MNILLAALLTFGCEFGAMLIARNFFVLRCIYRICEYLLDVFLHF